MAFRMIDFHCPDCDLEFEELVTAVDGKAEPEPCPKCNKSAPMITDFRKRVHRDGNRYRDVSWSTWNVS